MNDDITLDTPPEQLVIELPEEYFAGKLSPESLSDREVCALLVLFAGTVPRPLRAELLRRLQNPAEPAPAEKAVAS